MLITAGHLVREEGERDLLGLRNLLVWHTNLMVGRGMQGHSARAGWKELPLQGTQMLPSARGSANSKALAPDTG